jgi:hypothetical protein
MDRDKKNPAARGGAYRADLDFETKRKSFDDPQFNPYCEDCLASRLLRRRHGLSIHRARLICRLAGLGGVE